MKTHEDYSYDERTIVPGELLDLTKEGGNKRVRFVQPVGYGAKMQGRSFGKEDSVLAHYSTTGAYTGVDAQCADLPSTELVNFDKVYVSSSSSVPIRAYVVDNEVI